MLPRFTDVSESRRSGAMFLLTGVALVHVALVGQHFEEARYVGLLFLMDAVAAGIAAAAIRRNAGWWAWLLGGLATLGPFIMYFEARILGLPGFKETDWFESLGIASLVFEAWFLGLLARVTFPILGSTVPRKA